MKERKISKNFIWNIIGLSAYSFVSMFLLIVVNRINGTDKAGIFSYAFSITTLFFYFALFYNRVYQIANMSEKNFSEYLSARIITALLSLLFVIIFSLLSSFSLGKILIIFELMLFRVIDSISDCFYGFLQSKDNLYQVGISYSLKSTIGVLFFVIIDLITGSMELSIVGLIVVNILVFMFYDLHCFKKEYKNKIKFKSDFKNIQQLLISAIPVFLFTFVASFLLNMQKYVITYYASNEEQAIFGILIMPATMISIVGGYLMNPFVNQLKIDCHKNDFKHFRATVKKIAFLLFAIGLFFVILGRVIGLWFLEKLYNIELSGYNYILVIILCASILYALISIFSSVLTILNKNREQVVIYLLGSLFALAFCILPIYSSTITGATVSYLVSAIICFLLFLLLYTITIKRREGQIK